MKATVLLNVLGSTVATQYIILCKKTNVSLLPPSRTDLSLSYLLRDMQRGSPIQVDAVDVDPFVEQILLCLPPDLARFQQPDIHIPNPIFLS